jgi:hypothetical protein
MVKFAERAMVDLPFADQGKTIFCFLFLLAANKRKFAVSIFCLQEINEICFFPA